MRFTPRHLRLLLAAALLLPLTTAASPTAPVLAGPSSAATTVGIGRAKMIATHNSHTCAIASDNVTYCWGLNLDGQLGNGGTHGDLQGPDEHIVSRAGAAPLTIATGYSHTCAILADNTVNCWGNNFHGQLGNSTNTNADDGTRPPIVFVASSPALTTAATGAGVTRPTVVAGCSRRPCSGLHRPTMAVRLSPNTASRCRPTTTRSPPRSLTPATPTPLPP